MKIPRVERYDDNAPITTQTSFILVWEDGGEEGQIVRDDCLDYDFENPNEEAVLEQARRITGCDDIEIVEVGD